MAGNPFRRPKAEPADSIPPRDKTPPLSTNHTTKKKVTIQTPPRSPEEAPRRLSEGRVSPPPPPQSPDDEDDSDSTPTGELELEEAARNTRRNSGSLPPPPTIGTSTTKAPYNPFARTLATTEAAFGAEQVTGGGQETSRQNGEGQPRAGEGRAALDVDEFKSILLTGSANPSPAVSSWQKLQADNNSSTDTSSKRSLFDPTLDIHPDTPRASIEHMEMLESPSDSSDDEEDYDPASSADRLDDIAPTTPPTLTHGKSVATKGPQNVSFSDFEDSIRSTPQRSATALSPVTQSFSDHKTPTSLRRSASDLDQALPAPPTKSPIGADSATPNPIAIASDDSVPQKKAPPPPPAARRIGIERSRGDSNPKRERDSTRDDEAVLPPKSTETTAKAAAPPPPPSRKSRPTSQIATPATGTPPEAPSPSSAPTPVPASTPSVADAKTMRPPPPPRNPSKPGSGVNRSPSNASHSSTARTEAASSSLNAPPAPPPRRSGVNSNRTSMDGRPASLNEQRGSTDYGAKSERTSSLSNIQNVTESGEKQSDVAASLDNPKTDILADMSAFQAEIDALRAKAGNAG